jgi:hypothetical protein
VFDPGLGRFPKGHVRVGFLVSRYGYDFRAAKDEPFGRASPTEIAQKQAAREIPRRMRGLIA